ncbi:hypothetical protein [Sporomusa aerivorans]|uniref:hypothetical protein n=1 Tax=Sporomusa aerivorans TaxID=204936 RepID=UPI00352A0B88
MSTNSITATSNNELSFKRGSTETLNDVAVEKARAKAVQQKYEDLIRRIGPACSVIISKAAIQVQKSNQLVRENTVEALAHQTSTDNETTK